MPINPLGASWHTVSCQEQPFCTLQPESKKLGRTNTQKWRERGGWEQGRGMVAEFLLPARLARITMVLNVSWELNNCSPLIKIENKQMLGDSDATEKDSEDPKVQRVFASKKAAKERRQCAPLVTVATVLKPHSHVA